PQSRFSQSTHLVPGRHLQLARANAPVITSRYPLHRSRIPLPPPHRPQRRHRTTAAGPHPIRRSLPLFTPKPGVPRSQSFRGCCAGAGELGVPGLLADPRFDAFTYGAALVYFWAGQVIVATVLLQSLRNEYKIRRNSGVWNAGSIISCTSHTKY
ncbi:hypothetical protein B0H13DRAFT_2688285, partial [Mycena leptocephala]